MSLLVEIALVTINEFLVIYCTIKFWYQFNIQYAVYFVVSGKWILWYLTVWVFISFITCGLCYQGKKITAFGIMARVSTFETFDLMPIFNSMD